MSITTPPKDYQYLFFDMDAFFASVEQQVQPALREKPVGVAPYVGATGCIIAKSYEAKNRGVKTGTKVNEAKKLCPEISIVESRPALYRIYHEEIKKVIESFTPYFEALSIDEFVIKLTPREQNLKAALELGKNIKAAVKQKVGDYLTCSVGIGPNKFLAKMAGERGKPDGLLAVTLSELEKFYQGLDLLDITGINYRLKSHLNFFGVYSPTDFFNLTLPRLRQILNHSGRLWYYRLRGFEIDDSPASSAKSIGHSHVLPPKLRSRVGAEGVIRKLIFKTGQRLRREGYFASGVSVRIHFFASEHYAVTCRTSQFCDDRSFTEYVFQLLKKCSWQKKPVLVAVSLFGLSRFNGQQISLFSDIEKSRRISAALDEINDEYGSETIYPASMHGAKDSAPDRISFGKPNSAL